MVQTFVSDLETRRAKQLLRIEKAREVTELNRSTPSLGTAFAKVTLDFLEDLHRAGPLPDPLFISAYWPLGPSEIPTQPLLHALHEARYPCLLPVPVQENPPLLGFAPWTPETVLVEGPHQTRVPEGFSPASFQRPHVLLMPLLAFDQAGYRLGRGGGYYDATLRRLRSQPTAFFLAVGIAHAIQEISSAPREHHDEKMDALLAENKWFWF